MSKVDKASRGFERFMADIRAELGPHASLNQIEQAILNRQADLMLDVMSQLQEEAPPSEELSPLGAGLDS